MLTRRAFEGGRWLRPGGLRRSSALRDRDAGTPLDERYSLADMCEVERVVVVGHKGTASASTFLRTTG